MLEFRGKDISIREFLENDYRDPVYYDWLRDYSNIRNIYRVEYLKSLPFENVEDYARSVISSKDDAMFSIRISETGKFIGTVKLGHINWRTGLGDIGIMIGDKSSRGKGYSKEAVKLVCDYGFKILGLRKITGGTFSDNIPMQKCFLSNGFIQEGCRRKELLVDGEYLDHVLYGLLKDEFISK